MCEGQHGFLGWHLTENEYAPSMRQALLCPRAMDSFKDCGTSVRTPKTIPLIFRPYALRVCGRTPLRGLALTTHAYAPRMRQESLYARTTDSLLRYAPEVCARTKPLCSVCVLLREKEVCAQVCAEPKAPMDCLGQSSFETGYAPGMR